MSILEMKLAQEMASVDQEPLFLSFLDLCKAQNTVYCGLLLMNLEGYGAVHHMCRLLAVFWDQQDFLPAKRITTNRTTEHPGGTLRVDSFRPPFLS